MAEISRDAEIKGIWARYGWFYRLLRGAVLIGVGVLVGMLIYAEPQVRAEYVMNLFVTALSLGATALIFDELNRKRSENDLKRQLVDDAASTSNEVAKNAVHQIRRKGWLTKEDGLLSEKDLSGADLTGARLQYANLQGTALNYAILKNADLESANLRGATLGGTDLQDAWLGRADLRGADLSSSNLQAAHLWDVRLQGASLRSARLRGATWIIVAKFDDKTVLPDDTMWTPETNMDRFTDPTRPDFFEPGFG